MILAFPGGGMPEIQFRMIRQEQSFQCKLNNGFNYNEKFYTASFSYDEEKIKIND